MSNDTDPRSKKDPVPGQVKGVFLRREHLPDLCDHVTKGADGWVVEITYPIPGRSRTVPISNFIKLNLLPPVLWYVSIRMEKDGLEVVITLNGAASVEAVSDREELALAKRDLAVEFLQMNQPPFVHSSMHLQAWAVKLAWAAAGMITLAAVGRNLLGILAGVGVFLFSLGFRRCAASATRSRLLITPKDPSAIRQTIGLALTAMGTTTSVVSFIYTLLIGHS